MKITGYQSIYVGDGVEVVEATETSLSIPLIREQRLTGMPWETFDIPTLPQAQVSANENAHMGGFRRSRRRRWASRPDQEGVAFSCTISGQLRQVNRGAIIIDRVRPAARFLSQAFELGDAEIEHTEFFARLSRLKRTMKPLALQRMTEEYLTDGENLPSCLQLRRSFEKSICSHYHEGDPWYFSTDFTWEWTMIAPTVRLAHGHAIPRLGFLKEWQEHFYAFDGETCSVAHWESPAARRLLEKFADKGKIIKTLRVDVLPFAHLQPICWLRLPERGAVAEWEARSVAEALPRACPPYAYLFNSEAPIPVPAQSALPVLDDSNTVQRILSRTQGNIFAHDAPPMPVVDEWLHDEPRYLLLAVPKG